MQVDRHNPPGYFGKLPGKSDFVSRRLPRDFVEPWDAWLQQGIESSRDQLGPDWLTAYLNAPFWRFALAPGICGDWSAAGVIMSSVDHVGRYFPLTLAALLPNHPRPAQIFAVAGDWFDAAETLLLGVLDQPFDLESFDKRVSQIGIPSTAEGAPLAAEIGRMLRIPLAAKGDFGAAGPVLIDAMLTVLRPGYSLWWTVGSEAVPSACLVCQGLPEAEHFATLLVEPPVLC